MSGEMPEGAQPPSQPHIIPPPSNGLAAVDLLDTTPSTRAASNSRFEEYKVDENGLDEKVEGDIAVSMGELEIVKVKRKKKRAGR
jgi:hypothetical protein